MNKKNIIMAGIIYLAVFIVYNLTIFLIFDSHTNIFWLSYGFMIAAYIIHIVCVFFITRDVSVKTIFLGIPLLSFSLYFVCAELFCSLVFMFFQDAAGVKAAVIIQSLMICIFIVIAAVSIMTRDIVQDANDKIIENVNFIKAINVDVEMLIQRSTYSDITFGLKKLSETIKYSDPISNSTVAIQEQMIMQGMTELRTAFDSGDVERVKDICGRVNLLFIERNKKIMISK